MTGGAEAGGFEWNPIYGIDGGRNEEHRSRKAAAPPAYEFRRPEGMPKPRSGNWQPVRILRALHSRPGHRPNLRYT